MRGFLPLFVLLISPLGLILSSCSKDENSGPAPEETRETMLHLQAVSAQACPALTATYVCKSAPDQAGEPIKIFLKESAPQEYKYSYSDSHSSDDQSFLERQVEKLIFEGGGFHINGKIQEQLSMGKLLVEMFSGQKYAHQLRVAYVGSCNSNELKLHYVTGPTAIKNIIRVNEDKSLTQTFFQLNENGQIIKESGECQVVAEKNTPAPPPPTVYPSSLLVEVTDKNKPVDKEAVHVRFDRNGNIFARNTYLFNESFMGSNNEMGVLFWGHDNVNWMTPWKVVSVDFDKMVVFGGDKAGEGIVFAHLKKLNGKYSMEIEMDYKVDYFAQTLSLIAVTESTTQASSQSSTPVTSKDCPLPIQMMNQCPLYGGLFDTLAGMDLGALGEVGPGVVADVVSVSTVVQITKSVLFFNGSVDSIRDQYLIPALKAIGQLKALSRADKSDRQAYLEQARKAYSNLAVTSLDTAVKTQRLIPEALVVDAKSSFGLLLSYMGVSRPGEKLSGQPSWVSELVMPVALSFSSVAVDLVTNSSGRPLEERMNRFLELEAQLRQTVQKLCDSSPTNAQSECQAALNL